MEGTGAPLTLVYVEPENVYNVNFIRDTRDGFCLGDTLTDGMTFFSAQKGSVRYDAPMNTDDGSRRFHAKRKYIRITLSGEDGFSAALEQCLGGAEIPVGCPGGFAAAAEANKRAFLAFAAPFPSGRTYGAAAYILWSNASVAEGNFRRQPLVCSKAGMTRVWSWDNVFNALALAPYYPQKAFDQFMIPYDAMTPAGRLPDAISACTAEWTNVKPPVQGWAYGLMEKKHPFFSDRRILGQAYFCIKRNTDWWLNLNDGVPVYFHGNDSGADNATCFDRADCIASPDLSALLSLQCAFLARTAKTLGLSGDCGRYAAEADRLAEYTGTFYDGRVFVRDGVTGEKYYSGALMPLRALLLGDRLPSAMRTYIVKRLEEAYLGEYGLASEALDSPEYTEDGYWRGSLWSPDQYMFYEACVAVGARELTGRILSRYKSAVDKSGFFENYDAHTGRGERCKHFCWPVASYLL